jgi:phage shock protein A
MEKPSDEFAAMNIFLSGADLPSAKEYILNFISTVKLTEKKLKEIDNELTKWISRVELAEKRGTSDLILEAEKKVERIKTKQQHLVIEISEMKQQIEEMLRQLPLLAAKKRSIDTDLIEQELLMALGYFPGEGKKSENDRLFREMEKEADAEAALSELKAKMEK